MIRQNCFSCQTSPLWSMSDCDDDLFSFCLLKSILYFRLRTHHLYMLNVVMILLIPINSYYYYTYYCNDSIPMKRIKRPARFPVLKSQSQRLEFTGTGRSLAIPRSIISWVALAGDKLNAYESLCIIYFSISFQPLLQYYRPQTFEAPPWNLKQWKETEWSSTENAHLQQTPVLEVTFYIYFSCRFFKRDEYVMIKLKLLPVRLQN